MGAAATAAAVLWEWMSRLRPMPLSRSATRERRETPESRRIGGVIVAGLPAPTSKLNLHLAAPAGHGVVGRAADRIIA